MQQAYLMDAVQQSTAFLHGRAGFVHRHFLYHRMQCNRSSIHCLHETLFYQAIDDIHITQLQPVCKQPARNTGKRNQRKISHNIRFRIGQLIQGKQRMNMVIIGFLAAPAVLGDVNRIGDIQGGFFRFQLV